MPLRRAAAVCIAAVLACASPIAQERSNQDAKEAQGEAKGAAAGTFDFYVLALSWSPGYCALEGAAKAREQCEAGKRLGFVVHGLWPQYESGFPTECAPAGQAPSRLALEEAKGLYPDEALARFEWRRHGTCAGKSPSDYFADVRRAREKVATPPALVNPAEDQNWTPIDLERAFVAANPGLRTDMMAVACRRGLLHEVRICLSKDLRAFQSCPDLGRSGCRGGATKVLAVR